MEVGWFPCTRLCSLLERNAQAFRSRSEAIRIDQDPRAGNFVGRAFRNADTLKNHESSEKPVGSGASSHIIGGRSRSLP